MKHIMDETGRYKIVDGCYKDTKKRRVFYAYESFYRMAGYAGAALTGHCLSEYITVAVMRKIDEGFPAGRTGPLLGPEKGERILSDD